MLHLLPAPALVRTGPVDHADWNYRPFLGRIQRLRFQLVRSLLPPGKVNRLLEIGYGSGVFMPELARRCAELYGIDIHPYPDEVASRLLDHGITAQLQSGSAESLPYEKATFDCVVAVSSLEFVANIEAAVGEIRRVLRPSGSLVIVSPGHSVIVDWGLKMLTGASAQSDYGSRRQALLPALLKAFKIDALRTFPPLVGNVICLYSALRLKALP